MHPLLQAIQQRPAMYVGGFPIYEKLVAFIAGYEQARHEGASKLLRPLLPENFDSFVCQRLVGREASALKWQGLVARRAVGHDFMPKDATEDEAALSLFFELLDACTQQAHVQ